MNQHHNHDPIEYIKSLQLATAEQLYGNDVAPQGGAAVISDTVAVFDPNTKPQDEQDIKDAFCLAQLAAVKKFPGNDQATEYFYEVKTILSNVGFTNVGFEWNDVNTSSKDFTIEKELFDLLRSILSPTGFDLVQKTIAALRSSQDAGKPAWRIFSSNSHSDTNAKFSFGLVAPDGNNTMMTMTAFKLIATQVTENFLWSQWSSQNLQVQSAKVQFILNSQLYADKFRAAVQQKLGIKGKDFIADLDI